MHKSKLLIKIYLIKTKFVKMEYGQVLLFFISTSGLNAAYTPIGYLGCFDDSSVQNTNLDIKLSTSDTNSGEECMQRCSTNGYRYAGTKIARQCHCGTRIKNNQQTSGCVVLCTGRNDEYCGGPLQISIYDTWQCVREPCQNNARCNDIDSRTYTCSCIEGWQGENCTQEVQKPPASSTSVATTIRQTDKEISKSSVFYTTPDNSRTTIPASSALPYTGVQKSNASSTSVVTKVRKTNKKISISSVFYTTPDNSRTSIPTSSALPYTYSVSNNMSKLTTNARPDTEADDSVTLLKVYILAPVGLMVVVIAVVIPTFVIQKRRKRSIKRRGDRNRHQNEYTHYDDLYNSEGYSQPYYTAMSSGNEVINGIQLTTFHSTDLYVINNGIGQEDASYITPRYESTSDTFNAEYTYIDETRLSTTSAGYT
ncbi:uncharacterized protein LOC123551725 isoform X3 [Mercenaria mercenaria]|uniref:uncharacterized protein LOC123551725 isoform X3 n=1 Tax=Mercenaria mercenaria TaxID=6596 RepID=UPI00234ECE67|nr:uncharacterized protein LOC123551725 isoform X3 [Mercenaria mercenaria]